MFTVRVCVCINPLTETLRAVCVALTAVCGSVWLSFLLVGVVVVVVVEEVRVEDEVEGLQWPSLPALGRCQGQGGGSSAGLSTHERMLCGWVRTTANTSHTHTHSMHGAGQDSYKVRAMQLDISQKNSAWSVLSVRNSILLHFYPDYSYLCATTICNQLLTEPVCSWFVKYLHISLVHFKHRWKQICKVSQNDWNRHKHSEKIELSQTKSGMRLYSAALSNWLLWWFTAEVMLLWVTLPSFQYSDINTAFLYLSRHTTAKPSFTRISRQLWTISYFCQCQNIWHVVEM